MVISAGNFRATEQVDAVLISFRLPFKSSLHFGFRVQAAFGYIHISRFFKVFLLTDYRLRLLEILLCPVKKGFIIRPKLLGKRFNRCRHKRFTPAFFGILFGSGLAAKITFGRDFCHTKKVGLGIWQFISGLLSSSLAANSCTTRAESTDRSKE